MGFTLFLQEYIAWHYGKAFSEILKIGKNFLRFGYHFFSLPLLARTWISPWYRMREEVNRNWTYATEIGEVILGNIILRFIGFILRTFVLVLGLTFEVLVIAGTLILLVVWMLFPVILFYLLAAAVRVFF